MTDFIFLFLSYGLILGIVGIAGILQGSGKLGPRDARKLVHIGVAHWWILLMAFAPSAWAALAGPISFIILNALALRFPLFKALEDKEGARNLGTVYFPITLLILVLACWFGTLPLWMAACGVLVLGWGDGLAALLGARFESGRYRVWGHTKSLGGSLAMFGASLGVTFLCVIICAPEIALIDALAGALCIACLATLVEALTPWGLDNFTVPLGATLGVWLVFGNSLIDSSSLWLFLGALGLNSLVAFLAWLKKAVKPSGALAGIVVGTLLLWLGGWAAYALLMGFFLSSTVIGRITRPRVKDHGVEEKGSRRDAAQVLANCGPGVLAFILYVLNGNPVFLVVFAVAFAASTADTWASEIGILNRRPPRSIITLKVLSPGTSGGVSILGTLASLVGAVFISLIFLLGFHQKVEAVWNLPLVLGCIAFGGLAGSLIDSLFGATIQAGFQDLDTLKLTERPTSARKGEKNLLVKGVAWVNNDGVNFLSTLTAAAATGVVYRAFGG